MEVPPNHLKSDHWNRLKHLEINGDLGIPFKNLSVYGRTPGTQPVNSLGPRHWSVSSWPCRAQSQPEKLRHCSDPSRLGNHVTHRLYMYTIIPYYTHSYHKVIDIRTIICIYIILYYIILYYIILYYIIYIRIYNVNEFWMIINACPCWQIEYMLQDVYRNQQIFCITASPPKLGRPVAKPGTTSWWSKKDSFFDVAAWSCQKKAYQIPSKTSLCTTNMQVTSNT